MDYYQKFIFLRTYARWNELEQRRETWPEAVQRYMDYMRSKLGDKLPKEDYSDIHEAIVKMDIMPSMRLLWTAGPTVDKSNASAYNCSFVTPNKIKRFGEILYLLTNGCGVGFSVESKYTEQLPTIEQQTGRKLDTFVVPDTREGWADALVYGMRTWFDGEDVGFDYSKIRPLGTPLRTMGGRASGPAPLKSLLDHAKKIILARQGMKLRPIDVHDIITKIGEVVVAGGTRRSAQISLSDLNDEDMRKAKSGAFWELAPHRAMANNSAVFMEKPDAKTFMREWLALVESGTGERGIFNRKGTLPERRVDFLGEKVSGLGTNPCGEIILQPQQFCNLTEVVARPEDSKKDLIRKARLASILGTFQSSLTDFDYLSAEWKKNCDDERLLGVSITGQCDCETVRDASVLEAMKTEAISTNEKYAKKFGINPSTAVTTVKPSGTVSQLVNASSGIHPRYSKFYVRRVRISSTDPLFAMLREMGVPYSPENGQTLENATTYVLEFPMKSPDGALTIDDMPALEQLEHWKRVKVNYTEHNPSCSVYVKDSEWVSVANWVYENWDIVGGLSFFPVDSHVYPLAPLEKIDKREYERRVKQMPEIDFDKLTSYEKVDNTKPSMACEGATCVIE